MTSVQSRTNQRLEHSSVFCTEAKDGEEKLKSTKVNAQSTSVETRKAKKKTYTKKQIRPKFHWRFGSGP